MCCFPVLLDNIRFKCLVLGRSVAFHKKQAVSPLTSEGTGPIGSPLQSTDSIQ